MLKSEKAGQKFATESRLTRVQELKQARGQQKTCKILQLSNIYTNVT